MKRFDIIKCEQFYYVVDLQNSIKFKVFGNLQKALNYLSSLSFHDIVTTWVHVPDSDTHIEVYEF